VFVGEVTPLVDEDLARPARAAGVGVPLIDGRGFESGGPIEPLGVEDGTELGPLLLLTRVLFTRANLVAAVPKGVSYEFFLSTPDD